MRKVLHVPTNSNDSTVFWTKLLSYKQYHLSVFIMMPFFKVDPYEMITNSTKCRPVFVFNKKEGPFLNSYFLFLKLSIIKTEHIFLTYMYSHTWTFRNFKCPKKDYSRSLCPKKSCISWRESSRKYLFHIQETPYAYSPNDYLSLCKVRSWNITFWTVIKLSFGP